MEENKIQEDKSPDDIVREAYELVDPKHGTVFEKSRTAFVSFSVLNGSITVSTFLARAMGLSAGDRIAMIQSKTEPLKWLICKTKQRQRTKAIRINRGVYKINSLEWSKQVGISFRFNMKSSSLIRLYVNMEDTFPLPNLDNSIAMQMFDIPELREDFATPEEKEEYITYLKAHPYIIKPKTNQIK